MNSIVSFILGSGLTGAGYVIGYSLGASGSIESIVYGLIGGTIGLVVAIVIVTIEDWYICKRLGITSAIDDMYAWIRKRFGGC